MGRYVVAHSPPLGPGDQALTTDTNAARTRANPEQMFRFYDVFLHEYGRF
jgi:hypothetical protein